MTGRRQALLLAAALLLSATSAFHMTGLGMIAPLVADPPGGWNYVRIFEMLWIGPAFAWAIVAVIWVMAALRPAVVSRPVVLVTALIPLGFAAALFVVVGFAFPGPWMLIAASVTAIAAKR